jgi:hypothetical protein
MIMNSFGHYGLAWCLGIGVVSMGIAAVLFRRRTA